MSVPTLHTKFRFDAGHRLYQYEGRCRNIHGHGFELELILGPLPGRFPDLRKTGMLADYADVKRAIKGWLDSTLDHAMIVQQGDPLINFMTEHGLKYWTMKHPPTVEMLVEEIKEGLGNVIEILPTPLRIDLIRLHDTPSVGAEWKRP